MYGVLSILITAFWFYIVFKYSDIIYSLIENIM
jgi:hypothetical protein